MIPRAKLGKLECKKASETAGYSEALTTHKRKLLKDPIACICSLFILK